jgi:hypothetical protein
MNWRDELQAFTGDVVDTICNRIAQKGGFLPNESGKADIRRWLRRFTVAEILAGIDASFDARMEFNQDKPDVEAWNKAFRQVPRFIDIAKQEAERPYIRRLLYIQGIIRNRARAPRYQCVEYLEHLHICGADLDDMERRAKAMRALEDFEGPYDAWLDDIGRPF